MDRKKFLFQEGFIYHDRVKFVQRDDTTGDCKYFSEMKNGFRLDISRGMAFNN